MDNEPVQVTGRYACGLKEQAAVRNSRVEGFVSDRYAVESNLTLVLSAHSRKADRCSQVLELELQRVHLI